MCANRQTADDAFCISQSFPYPQTAVLISAQLSELPALEEREETRGLTEQLAVGFR
jgi:hypothetical protein